MTGVSCHRNSTGQIRKGRNCRFPSEANSKAPKPSPTPIARPNKEKNPIPKMRAASSKLPRRVRSEFSSIRQRISDSAAYCARARRDITKAPQLQPRQLLSGFARSSADHVQEYLFQREFLIRRLAERNGNAGAQLFK